MDNELCIRLLKEEIDTNGQIQLVVHGDSMLPTLKNKDKVVLEKKEQIDVGDIVGYYIETDDKIKIVVHRAIFVRKTYILTKGDNNDFIDPIRVVKPSILGVVRRKNDL